MVSFTVILRPFQSPVALAVITDLFWRQAQGADLGGQGRSGTDFPTGAPQVHDFDLVGVELMRHGGGGWCRMNPDSGRPKEVAPSPPPSRKLKAVSNIFATPWTVALQAPLSTGFPKQEYWSGLPYPPPGDLPDPGIEPASLTSPALAGGFFTTSAPWETLILVLVNSHLSRQSQFKCHHLPEIFLDCQPAINSCFLFAQHLCKMAITIAMLLLVKYLSPLPDSSVCSI